MRHGTKPDIVDESGSVHLLSGKKPRLDPGFRRYSLRLLIQRFDPSRSFGGSVSMLLIRAS